MCPQTKAVIIYPPNGPQTIVLVVTVQFLAQTMNALTGQVSNHILAISIHFTFKFHFDWSVDIVCIIYKYIFLFHMIFFFFLYNSVLAHDTDITFL